MFSSNRLFADWKVVQPNEQLRKEANWNTFVNRMKEFHQATENLTLMNFHFRALTQLVDETFLTFCNCVVKEAKHCHFKCQHENCTAEEIAIRDQIVIGMHDNSIRDEALKQSWDLQTLRKERMKM